jgi:mannan endo-1,4-beta-mannosidase
VSAFIKSLDRGHMVALGDEGWMDGGGDGTYPYTTWEGVDFEEVLKLPVSRLYSLLL